ncbi:hypothetical protein PM082_006281 [Marasmius tenuissimus]|nr:hypothetical protein PM082_006281 [Marasmius tenuissimus]
MYFYSKLTKRYPFFGFCESDWKAEYFATKQFPQWKKSKVDQSETRDKESCSTKKCRRVKTEDKAQKMEDNTNVREAAPGAVVDPEANLPTKKQRTGLGSDSNVVLTLTTSINQAHN